MAARPDLYLGIDVARDHLDVAVHPTGTAWRVANTPTGHAALRQRVQGQPYRRLVLEASGGYEQAVAGVLATAGLPVVVVNPRQVRDSARARGILAKTDTLDAQVLAHFAATVQPGVRPRPDAATQHLHDLVTRRRQLRDMRGAEQQRRPQAAPAVRADIDAALAVLTASRIHPRLRAFYHQLLAAGKPPKLALTACLRKLPLLCKALCKQQAPWNPAMAT
ncbi:MAG: transposase [Chloroflexi bacterium]|nr:transposase [Chloroflexota bacterium]